MYYNRNPDRSHAVDKIDLVHTIHPNIEFLGIALPFSEVPFHLPPDQRPGNTAHANVALTQPSRAPYMVHWDINHNPIYYRMDWDRHITLRCGFIVDFNMVLNGLC